MKICGLARRTDAEAAADAGADYLGFVFAAGSPRRLEVDEAARLARGLSPEAVVVLVDPTFDEAARAAEAVGAGVVQLHGREEPELLSRLRGAGPWTIWKAASVRSVDDVTAAIERYGTLADALLLDGWDPRRRGGTGARVPAEAVRHVRRHMPSGLGLVAAGGLDPQTVHETVRVLSPDVVDVSSGVERRPGVKDPDLVRAFVRNARRFRDCELR